MAHKGKLININAEFGEYIRRYMPVIAVLVLLAMLYLQNGFGYERQLRQLDHSRQELEDKKYTYITLQKELNDVGRRSAVRSRLKKSGSAIADSRTPIELIDE